VSRHLGLDLGGSAIKAVVLERDGDSYGEVTKTVVPTDAGEPPARIVGQIADVGRTVAAAAGGVDTVGITIPGTFDLGTGVAHFVTNLGGASWDGVPVLEPVRETLGLPTRLINDARAFGFAEWSMRVDAGADAPLCGCGNRGCVVAHVRASAIARAGGRGDPASVVAAARAGDARARDALAEAGRWLGLAIANVTIVLNPERVVIGGGVAEAGDLILGPAREEIARRVRVPPAGRTEVVWAELGYEAGSVGAALWGAEAA
jgi:glucokinase